MGGGGVVIHVHMQIGCEFCMTMYQFFVVQYFARGSETLYTYT